MRKKESVLCTLLFVRIDAWWLRNINVCVLYVTELSWFFRSSFFTISPQREIQRLFIVVHASKSGPSPRGASPLFSCLGALPESRDNRLPPLGLITCVYCMCVCGEIDIYHLQQGLFLFVIKSAVRKCISTIQVHAFIIN